MSLLPHNVKTHDIMTQKPTTFHVNSVISAEDIYWYCICA